MKKIKSFTLTNAAPGVLRDHPKSAVFPVISAIFGFFVLAAFVVPVLGQ